MKKLIIIIALILISCTYKVKSPIQPISFIESHKLDTTKIRFNGYYNTLNNSFTKREYDINYDKENSNLYRSLYLKVFGKTKNIYIDEGGSVDNESFNCEYYKWIINWYKDHNQECFGKYIIKNDSIYSYSPTHIIVGGGRKVIVNCNYRGFVKNKDTIIDWKVIPPYPKDFTNFVIENNEHLFKPQTLYFVKTDAVKCLQMN